MNWLIAIPAWGERCLRHFEQTVYPAAAAALSYAGHDARFLVHTDEPERLNRAMTHPVKFLSRMFERNPDLTNPHCEFEFSQKEALDLADEGEALVLLNGDTIVSVETFVAAGALLAEGKKLIVAAGTRTVEGKPAPVGVMAPNLLSWAWHNRHPWIEDCIWGKGYTESPSMIYFELDDGVVLHALHLHPLVVVKRKGLQMNGSSDGCLPHQFRREDVHVVTDEFALAEMSPLDCGIMMGCERRLTEEPVRRFASGQSDMHRYFFEHRIPIFGWCNDKRDVEICKGILQ